MPQTDRVAGARRILVYGVTGAGKSTLARELAAILGIPATSVDDITWSPGWVPMPTEDQIAYFDRLTRTDAWLLDSAYGTWRELVMERADLVVALDYPRLTSLCRLLRRTVARVVDGQEVCNGNRETLRAIFDRDSIVLWHCTSYRRKRREMRRRAAARTGPPVVLLHRVREAEAFLERVRGEAAGAGRVSP